MADARNRRDEARKLIANNVDPNLAKKAQKEAQALSKNTLETIAREWYLKFGPTLAANYSEKIIRRFELFVFPYLGSRLITDITDVSTLFRTKIN